MASPLVLIILAGAVIVGGTSVPFVAPDTGRAISSAIMSVFSPPSGPAAAGDYSSLEISNNTAASNATHTGSSAKASTPVGPALKSSGNLFDGSSGTKPTLASVPKPQTTPIQNASSPPTSAPGTNPPTSTPGSNGTLSQQSGPQSTPPSPPSNSPNSQEIGSGGGGGGGGGGGSGGSYAPPPTSTPTLSLPGALVAEATNSSGAVVNFTSTAHDVNNVVLKVQCSLLSGAIFPIAVTTVTCSTTGSSGLTASGQFTVTVRVTIPPRIVAPADVTADSTGQFTQIALGNPVVTDPVDGSPSVVNNAPAAGFPIGNTTVTWTATDHYGNSATAMHRIRIVVVAPNGPTVTVPANMVVEAKNSSGSVVSYSVSARDPKDGALVPVCVPASGTIFPIGHGTVHCTATNSAGKTATASFDVTVRVTIPPGISAPSDIVANSTGQFTSVALGSPVVIDAVDSSPTISNSAPTGGFPVGENTVTWTATDHYGNSASATQHVTINVVGAPQTQLSIGTGSYASSQNVYVSSSTSISLSGHSSHGIATTYYRYFQAGGSVPAFSQGTSFSVSGSDGSYMIQYYSRDSSGTSEPVNNAPVILDNSPPQTTPSAADGTILLPTGSLNFTATDGSGSGVGGSSGSGVYYSIDNKSPFVFSESSSIKISMNGLLGGFHNVTFYAVDNLGNKESLKFTKFVVYDCGTIPLAQIRGVAFGDPALVDIQGSWPTLPGTPPPLETRMADISSKGFNTLRVIFYWDAYMKHKAATLAEMATLAATAQNYNLCVIFDNHQWNTGFKYGGAGFPANLTADYATQNGFWTAYYKNSISVNGISAWDLHANMMTDIVQSVDRYPSVLGYETLNEPYVWYTWQYAKLGQLQSYVDGKMRAITSKQIWFDKAEPQGYAPGTGYANMPGVNYVDMTYDPKTMPSGVSNIVFAPHEYNSIYAPGLPPQDVPYYQQLDNAMGGMPLIIGEWGQTTQAGTSIFISTFKSDNIGWLRWCYDPFDTTYNLMDASYKPTANMQYLLDAMAAN